MVFIVSPNSRTTFLNLNPNTTTLYSLKQTFQHQTHIPISQENILIPFNNSTNDDSTLLSHLGVTHYSTLTLHLPLLSGASTTFSAPPPPPNKPRLDFLNSKPPPNYVTRLGCGATGFTTQFDIGSARAALDLLNRFATIIGGAASSTSVGKGHGKPEDEDNDEKDNKGYDENQKFDEFEGNDVGLFANSGYDEDDKKADPNWEAIDKRMDSCRKDRREARLNQEIEKYQTLNPNIIEQFADLKRKLYMLSAYE